MGEQQNKPIKVLQINAGSKNYGGVSSFLYNVYTNIDTKIVQFDFLSPNLTTFEIHRSEIEQKGGEIIELLIDGNILSKKIKLYYKLNKFLMKHDYDIIHINSGNIFFNYVCVKAAQRAECNHIIIHSHNAGTTSNSRIKYQIARNLKSSIEVKPNELYACSNKAAEYMFTKKSLENNKVSIIRNGISVERFIYNIDIRNEIRDRYCLIGKLVLGHVGRFENQKNHEFLIKIFEELNKLNPDVILMLFGSGEKEDKIKKMVINKELEDKVCFCGTVNNIEDMYQAMDVFILPSFHEGLPVTCVEAQVSGLPCLLSDSITEEVAITDRVVFLSLSKTPSEWAHVVLSLSKLKRYNRSNEITNCGYSIKNVAENLTRRYMSMVAKDR